MSSRLRMVFLAFAILAAAPFVWGQDTLDSVQKAVVERMDALSSTSTTIAGTADIKLKPENPTAMHVFGSGGMDYAKKDGKVFARAELSAALSAEATAKLARVLGVFDGKDAYYEVEFFGKVESHMLANPLGDTPPSAKALFDLLKQNFDLVVLPSEKMGNKDAYVLSGNLKAPSNDLPLSRLQLWLAQDTGVILKVVGFDKQNAPFLDLNAMDIQLNQPIPDERFKYTPPPPPAPKPAPAPAAPTTPAPSPAPAAPATPVATPTKAAPSPAPAATPAKAAPSPASVTSAAKPAKTVPSPAPAAKPAKTVPSPAPAAKSVTLPVAPK